jgi:alanine racemase
LEIDLLLSHLASADVVSEQNDAQLKLFLEMSHGVPALRLSLANSAGIMLGRDFHFNLTRPGLSLYGGIVRDEQAEHITPVVRVQPSVLQIREHPEGALIGYNATHRCDRPTRVATLALGYADGYGRSFSGKGIARFAGIEMPILGRVSMDLLTVDATACPSLKEGDWVDVDYDLHSASQISGRSQYELLTGLGMRAERVWV